MQWGASHLLSQKEKEKKRRGGGGVMCWSKLLISAHNNVQRFSAASRPLVYSAFSQEYYRLKAIGPSVLGLAGILTRHEWEKLLQEKTKIISHVVCVSERRSRYYLVMLHSWTGIIHGKREHVSNINLIFSSESNNHRSVTKQDLLLLVKPFPLFKEKNLQLDSSHLPQGNCVKSRHP